MRFDDVERARAWLRETSDSRVLDSISKNAGLSAPPEFWLGEDIEDAMY